MRHNLRETREKLEKNLRGHDGPKPVTRKILPRIIAL